MSGLEQLPAALAWLPQAGLVIFLLLFVALVSWVLLSGSRASWKQRSRLPLEDGTAAGEVRDG